MPEQPTRNPGPEQVRDFYDRWLWLHDSTYGSSLHQGLWDTGAATLSEAQDRLTDELIKRLAPGPGAVFLDAGSGTGRPAIRLAAATAASVEGIDLSGAQTTVAVARSFDAGLAAQVRFTNGDMTRMPFGDETFDAGWEIESLWNVADRASALGEILRVLKPGARFLLAEATVEGPVPEQHDEFVRGFQPAPSSHDYLDLIRASGFEILANSDERERVKDTGMAWYGEISARQHEIAEQYGHETARGLLMSVFELALFQMKSWGYLTVLARKPGDSGA